MTGTDLIVSQFLDPFRIGLLIALVLTAYNTAGTVGLGIPLALGCVFVAVLLPVTMQADGETATLFAVATGLVVNAVVIGAILGARALWMRFGAQGGK